MFSGEPIHSHCYHLQRLATNESIRLVGLSAVAFVAEVRGMQATGGVMRGRLEPLLAFPAAALSHVGVQGHQLPATVFIC
jgi:hypothetical protein